MAIHILCVKSVKVPNANVNHRTNLLAETVYWLDAKTVANVRQEPIVSRLLVVLAIALARKVSEHKRMDRALMSTSASRIITSVDSALNVLIDRVATIAFVHLVMVAIHTMGE